jgi:tetratricopeptide (TPR) repeat protein
MNTFEITIKEGQEGSWPVETELTRTHDRLPVHHKGTLKLSKEDIKQLNLTRLNIQRQKYGEFLGQALFKDNVRDAYLQAIDSSLEGGIRVLLTVEDPELQALYWHWLCTPRDWNSISRNQRCCFSIGLKYSKDRVFPPINPQDLKALILVASPEDLEEDYSLAPFNVEETVNYLKTALGEIPTDILTVDSGLGIPNLDGLCDRLTQTSYGLLHIVGHGKVNSQGETILYWATKDNQIEVVTGSNLIERLGKIKNLPHFIFLSACQSAKTEAGMPLGGLAQRMVRKLGIPAVLAMTENVTIETAGLLSKAFYPRLRKHGEVDKALVEATSSLSRHDILVPALFRRLGGRSLFIPESELVPILEPPQNLPISGVVKFVGRETIMDELHQKLQQTERIAISAVSGMGGVGKTELALQYAGYHRDQQTYQGGICWIRAREEDVGIQIVNFGRSQLKLNPPDDFDLKTQVDFCWRNWLLGEVLVILDDVQNFEEIKDYLPPQKRFKTLITTRERLGPPIERIDLDVLAPDDAKDLLQSFLGEERITAELEVANELCQWLGYLPLGLELVGRYLVVEEDLSLAEMLEQLKEASIEDESLEEAEAIMTAQRGVAAAFELSWQQLSENAHALGNLLSLFALAPIPWSLVESASPDRKVKDLRRDRRELINFNLTKRVDKDTYQLHQLIREFFRGKLEKSALVEDCKHKYCHAIAVEAKEIPEKPTHDDILAVTSIIPHIEEVAENLTDWLTDEDLIQPFVGLYQFYNGQGLYNQAEPWCENCLDLTQNRLGQQHPDVASSLRNLAILYLDKGKYEQAEPLFQQALEMRQLLLRPQHPDTAQSLNNLALLYEFQGKYEQAEPLYKRALEMYQQLFGPQHPSIADSLENFVVLYYKTGKYEQAEPLCQQVLEMRRQLLGQQHPDVAESLHNLASLYHLQSQYEEAESLYLQALEMRRQLLGQQHPHVANTLNNLANLYHLQSQYEEAESLYLQALEMRRQLLGQQHPDVATCLHNLANLYRDQGKYEQAEPLFIQTLEMDRQLLGQQHPHVATCLHNLANLYRDQGKYEQAEPLYIRALSIAETVLGVDHPNTKKIQENLDHLLELKSEGSGEVEDSSEN